MMANLRNVVTHPALALGSVVLWGLVEFIALQLRRIKARDYSRP